MKNQKNKPPISILMGGRQYKYILISVSTYLINFIEYTIPFVLQSFFTTFFFKNTHSFRIRLRSHDTVLANVWFYFYAYRYRIFFVLNDYENFEKKKYRTRYLFCKLDYRPVSSFFNFFCLNNYHLLDLFSTKWSN